MITVKRQEVICMISNVRSKHSLIDVVVDLTSRLAWGLELECCKSSLSFLCSPVLVACRIICSAPYPRPCRRQLMATPSQSTEMRSEHSPFQTPTWSRERHAQGSLCRCTLPTSCRGFTSLFHPPSSLNRSKILEDIIGPTLQHLHPRYHGFENDNMRSDDCVSIDGSTVSDTIRGLEYS
jgi:hypothetical protein